MLTLVPLFLNIGTPEMILILFVALMLFGGNKLPELARGLGKGIREFKDASEDVKREINNQINNYEDKKPAAKVEEKAVEAEDDNNTAANYKPYEPVEGAISAYTGHSATDAIEESTPAADATFENETEVKPAAETQPASSINLTKPEEAAPEKKATEE
ncbi:twin-arginine translocase TatA/TatE family subunit [Mucilaginibacter conchicola]|uniref:Sec-independent protein translocase protein TatA n=1 Tax=Mucilaginibacter conchicola TaxID=2303333 RepID=A0A372P0N4_9SPHI|nr:twin-arginine translocase TatA/TatE family subunit [Mucilaginibacter conchicola]RFZ95684.1 twin-arginine translocase TatA/TatE family subunit [Mucilaginibacter conchicola]